MDIVLDNVFLDLFSLVFAVSAPVLLLLLHFRVPRRADICAVTAVGGFVALGVTARWLDAWMGLSVSWILIAFVAAWGSTLVVAAPVTVVRPLRLLGGVFLAWLLVLHFVDVTPVKRFRRFFDGVECGMSKEHVLAQLDREYRDGRFQMPIVEGEAQYIKGEAPHAADSNEWLLIWGTEIGNCELIKLHFADGRVVGKQYSMD